MMLREDSNAENVRLLLTAASFSNPSASVGLKDAAFVLADIDERLIRSILRCAFNARIAPGRDWQGVHSVQREQQTIECATNLATRISEEVAWLTSNGPEPQWPQFPAKRPHLRNGYRGQDSAFDMEEEDESAEQLDFADYGAAQWLKAAEGLFDIATRPWLREFVDYYRHWTNVANGVGIDKNTQIDGEPGAWTSRMIGHFPQRQRSQRSSRSSTSTQMAVASFLPSAICYPSQSPE